MAGLVALEKMVMLVLLMVVGFAAAKAKWVDGAFSQRASHMVANVFIVATWRRRTGRWPGCRCSS